MSARPNGPAIVVPPHPLGGVGGLYVTLGVLAMGFGGCLTAAAPSAMTVALFAVGLVAFGFGRSLGAALRALPAMNTGIQLLRQGRTDDAVTVVSTLRPTTRGSSFARRGVGLVRATAALNDGALVDAEREASAAIPGGTQLLFGVPERQLRASAQAVRALARAGLGRGDDAIADARAVFATAEADPHALAQARLAEALVLARKEDVEGLAAHLAANRRLVAEHGLPRERVVLRGLLRLVKARRAGVYREPAVRDASGATREPSAFARWAGAFVPGLADTVGDVPPVTPMPFTSHVPVSAAPAPSPFGRLRRLIVWSALVVVFLTIWQFLTPSEPRVDGPARPSAPAAEPARETMTPRDHLVSAAQAAAAFGALVLFAAWVKRRTERAALELAAARRALALDAAEGERKLDALSRRGGIDVRTNGQYFAIACAELARRAVRRGDPIGAVARCDQGLGILGSAAGGQAAAADLALPWLLGERAVALAAARQPEAASAEIGRVLSSCAGFPDAPTVTLRARLVADVARGVLDGAADAARSRTLDMPIPLHEDLLADVVLAARGVMAKDERERIAEELAAFPDVAAWIQTVAPGLVPTVLGPVAPPAS